MGEYVVQPGDCLASIAKRFGFADWRTIYEHPDNQALRDLRPNPNLVFEGDTIVIPEREPASFSLATGQRHVFQLAVPKTQLRLTLVGSDGAPLVGVPYTLRVGGREMTGDTKDGGAVVHDVPADAMKGELVVGGVARELLLGWLDPVETTSGVQARLQNLGYECGAVDGVFGPKTEAAVRAFQEDHPPLVVDGVSGPETRRVLVEEHGC
jgi:N-acetylmuramoyl-L-alanine amidase